jgi:uncharacterized protein
MKVPPTAEQVADYLRYHDDFFLDHSDLLLRLQLPRAGGGTASLVERQLVVMREQIGRMRQEIHQLTATASQNEQLFESLQLLIVKLVASNTLQQLIDTLTQQLSEQFAADGVALQLFTPHDHPLATTREAAEAANLASLLGEGHPPLCGILTAAQRGWLFPHDAAIVSALVLPICAIQGKETLGLLAIGSKDEDRYHAQMGTQLVRHLGFILYPLLQRHLGHT